MRNILILFSMLILFSLGACLPAEITPAKIYSPGSTLPVVTTAPVTISVTPIPITEGVSTPTLPVAPKRTATTPVVTQESPILVAQTLTITIIYDNIPFDHRLNSAWGFSALIEYRDYNLLFDTGGDGHMLMKNMAILGIDPALIDGVVLSHAHDDHTAGLSGLLNAGAHPIVYLLPSFPVSFKRQVEQFTEVSEVSPGQSFSEGLWTSGEIGINIPEQALIIRSGQGLVIITGCAHPGIVAIIEQARDMFNEPVRLVLGGFHLGNKSEAEIDAILMDFRRLEVEQVAPSHCTGELAMTKFATEYGKDFIKIGVGSVIRLDDDEQR